MKIGQQQVSNSRRWRASPAPESRRASVCSETDSTTTECTAVSLEEAAASLTLADDYVPGPNLIEALPAELFSEIISFVYEETIFEVPSDWYRYFCRLGNRKVFSAEDCPETKSPLLVNKHFAAEGTQALYRNTTFSLSESSNECTFLDTVGSANLANIRSIELSYPGSHRQRENTRRALHRLSDKFPNLARLRIHIPWAMVGAASTYSYHLQTAFVGQRRLMDLSLERSWGGEHRALHWTSRHPFAPGDIVKMLSSGCYTLSRRIDQNELPCNFDQAVLDKAVALHASKYLQCCGDYWVRTNAAGEDARYELGLEPQLTCEDHQDSAEESRTAGGDVAESKAEENRLEMTMCKEGGISS
ncbi:hypothetical protein B0A48_04078 [Cryoendolithus antarcticus]|uniref:F-box domain-containing protein n=1 Tax=Cryoendolithus antarcticus TaxID=1507870 RepID=A0A1V8THP0_9PEZI|nr:hypothetical protein B0A48_04078 [Cryoendolithus antarcticus]